MKFVVTGNIETKIRHKQAVFIGNHGAIQDMMYFFHFLPSINQSSYFGADKFKRYPFIGLFWQMHHCIFVQRKWENDKDHVINSLRYLSETGPPLHVVIFPEGRLLMESTKAADKEYANRNNLQVYQNLLFPKLNGFINTVHVLREYGSVDVYDVTTGYVEKPSSSSLESKEIHFHIKHYPSSCLPSTDEELSQWLKMRWDEKEQLLTQFYNTHSFPGPVNKEIQRSKLMMSSVLFMWLAVFIGIIYCCINVPLLMISAFIVPLIIHYVINKLCGGWDKLVIQKWLHKSV